tara:strand:+ start:362 stop:1456 length:1095 start_codon:yes stop_codon:yes gene_type:complete
MISNDLHNKFTPILAGIITVGIFFKYIDDEANVREEKLDYWDILNIVALCFVIIASTSLGYRAKIFVFIVSIVWFGSTIIQHLASGMQTWEENKECNWRDIFSGNLMYKPTDTEDFIDSKAFPRILFVMLYLFTTLIVMVILLYKIDSPSKTSSLLYDHPNVKYLLVILLPLIVVFTNEYITANINIYGNPEGDNEDKPWMTSELLFKRFITGNYEFSKDGGYLWKFIITSLFLGLLFILLINYSFGGEPAIFSDILGTGNSNMPVYVMIFILMFFNFIVETLFMEKCSFETKDINDTPPSEKTYPCRLAKYGGIITLLFISYTTSILYQIDGIRDKIVALLFILSLTFGFSELFISVKGSNKK